MQAVPWTGTLEEHVIYRSSQSPGFCAWVTAFSYDEKTIGLSFDEVLQEPNPRPLPSIAFAEAAGVPVSYGSVECGSPHTRTWRVYLKSTDGVHFMETGRCLREEGTFLQIGFPDGRLMGYDMPRRNPEGTGWGDAIHVRESLDGGSHWTLRRKLLEGTSCYLWRARRLRDGTVLLLASLYGTPWGTGRERSTRNTMLPGETALSKVQAFFLTSGDGLSFSPPCYILPGIGAHEYDVAELEDGRLCFIAGDVQGTPVGRQIATPSPDGYILSPLLPIGEGAPPHPRIDPQGGFIPETLCRDPATGLLLGCRRNKGYAVSNDEGTNWVPLALPSGTVTPYQPVMIPLPGSGFGVYGHRGGDQAFGEQEMFLFGQMITPGNAPQLPATPILSLERCLSPDTSHYVNAYRARLTCRGIPLSGKTIHFRALEFWTPEGSVNTATLEDSPLHFSCVTDADGWAEACFDCFNRRPDIHLAYWIQAFFGGDEAYRPVQSPLRTELAMTPYRGNPFPYEAYFAGDALFLSPALLAEYPQAAEEILAAGENPLTISQELLDRLARAGAIIPAAEGFRWYPNVHRTRLAEVKPMPPGDDYQ